MKNKFDEKEIRKKVKECFAKYPKEKILKDPSVIFWEIGKEEFIKELKKVNEDSEAVKLLCKEAKVNDKESLIRHLQTKEYFKL